MGTMKKFVEFWYYISDTFWGWNPWRLRENIRFLVYQRRTAISYLGFIIADIREGKTTDAMLMAVEAIEELSEV